MASQEEFKQKPNVVTQEDLERLIRQYEIEKAQRNQSDEELRRINESAALEQKQYDDKWEGKPTGSRPEDDED